MLKITRASFFLNGTHLHVEDETGPIGRILLLSSPRSEGGVAYEWRPLEKSGALSTTQDRIRAFPDLWSAMAWLKGESE